MNPFDQVSKSSSEVITSDYKSKMVSHYKPLVSKFGFDYRSNDWGSDEGQVKRYKVLLELIQYQNFSLLDVGCGIGHMASFLKSNNFTGTYLGVDIVPAMISQAKEKLPEYSFQLISSYSELVSFKPDFTVASGIFTFVDQEMFFQSISELFDLSNKAFVFNALSSWKSVPEKNEFHADPLVTLQYCSTITKNLAFMHNYLPHDFTIAMYK